MPFTLATEQAATTANTPATMTYILRAINTLNKRLSHVLEEPRIATYGSAAPYMLENNMGSTPKWEPDDINTWLITEDPFDLQNELTELIQHFNTRT